MKRLLHPLLIVFMLLVVYSCGDDDDGRTKFTVTFDTDGGSAVPSKTVKEGDKVSKPEDPTKDNCVFQGWYLGDDRFNFVSTSITADITLKALFKRVDAFSISETKQVYFSKGNLQYNHKNKEWRFAPNQYDCIGREGNSRIARDDYDGYIDLFGWGTGDNPILATTENDHYANFTDWGVNIDGGNVWRTLAWNEWQYLIVDREDSRKKFTAAEVAGVPGLILLPDYFVLPEGISFRFGMAGYIYDGKYLTYKESNDISASDWQKLESAGAVFFPAAGSRAGNMVFGVGEEGFYWGASSRSGLHFYELDAYGGNLHGGQGLDRYHGFSVRLARDL
ncbi:MAG: InlB B-repeat-containing protein [Bacteroidales bacterium]|nr:InlB B-repeat-containing protein [Bacteroidales bacterium]